MVAGDSCANPIAIVLGADGGTAVVADTTGAAFSAAHTFQCAGALNSDLVFEFTTPAQGNLVASVAGLTNPRLELQQGAACTASALVSCVQASSLSVTSLPAGHYFLWVATQSPSANVFQLNVRWP